MTTVLDYQRRLADLGYDLGPLDGIRGRQTIAAIKRYQTAMHLAVDGIVGPQTLRALFGGAEKPASQSPDATPWLDYGYRAKGLREGLDNARLRQFLASDGKTVGDPAKVPWCGDFVQTCLAMTLTDEPLPVNPYAAINWATWGKETTPKRGAILSFWRGSPAGWEGHVGFYIGEDAGFFHVLGGNQSDMISETKIAKSRLRAHGCRWPMTALSLESGAVIADGSGLIETTNEE